VDHIDKRLFLSALKDAPTYPSGQQPSKTIEEPEPEPAPEPSPEIPEPKIEEHPPAPPSSQRTVVEMTEPVIPDQSLSELRHSKVLSTATPSLFASEAQDAATETVAPKASEEDTVKVKRAAPEPTVGSQTAPIRRHVRLEDEEKDSTPLYSRLRRRDDIFRYLEDNLMEVNFSGKVFIKQGSIYSYSGNLTFWVKPQRDETVSPLVIVSGNGKLLLSDRQREISVMQLKGEEVFVEPTHLLACQETLAPRYAVIRKEGDTGTKLRVLAIEGSGMIALSAVTSPLVLTVTEDFPVNVSSDNVISWSGQLTPSIVDDAALAELMFPHNPQAVNLRLEGTGQVMMEKSSI
jgi:uncharacterized protein (AIM24 family)